MRQVNNWEENVRMFSNVLHMQYDKFEMCWLLEKWWLHLTKNVTVKCLVSWKIIIIWRYILFFSSSGWLWTCLRVPWWLLRPLQCNRLSLGIRHLFWLITIARAVYFCIIYFFLKKRKITFCDFEDRFEFFVHVCVGFKHPPVLFSKPHWGPIVASLQFSGPARTDLVSCATLFPKPSDTLFACQASSVVDESVDFNDFISSLVGNQAKSLTPRYVTTGLFQNYGRLSIWLI